MSFSRWDSEDNFPLKKDKAFDEFEIDLNTIDYDNELIKYMVDTLVGEGIDNMRISKIQDVENDELKLFAISLMKANGATDKEIAKKLGITSKQFKNWRNESELIAAAYNDGKADICRKIAGKMATRAFGYDYEETKQTVMGDVKKGSNNVENQRTVKIEKTTKHMAPDVGAQIFLLTNLDGEHWKNNRNVKSEIDATVKGSSDITNAIVEAFEKRKKDGIDKDGNKEG